MKTKVQTASPGKRTMRFVVQMVFLSLLGFVLTQETGIPVNAASPAGEYSFPDNDSPLQVGRRVANYTVENLLGSVDYPTSCCAYGVLLFSDAAGDNKLRDQIERIYAPYLSGSKSPGGDVDGRLLFHRWFGVVPFELYRQTGNKKYLEIAKKEAKNQFVRPSKDSTVYYIDAVYGVAAIQSKAFKFLSDEKFLRRCIDHHLVHIEKLQKANGLFHHAEGSPYFWGRGNGWAAAAMTEILLIAPKDYPGRSELMVAWRRLIDALVKYQDRNGMWHQIVDSHESWIETSGTSMFIFALATGLEQKWLPEKPYKEVVERGWRALSSYVDSQGRLKEVCVGLSARPDMKDYLSWPRELADKHGQAPLLWAAAAMMQLNK